MTVQQLRLRETLNHIYYVNTACLAPVKLLIVPLTYLHINLIAIDENCGQNLTLSPLCRIDSLYFTETHLLKGQNTFFWLKVHVENVASAVLEIGINVKPSDTDFFPPQSSFLFKMCHYYIV